MVKFTCPEALRQACRSGTFKEPTSGECPGYIQGNLTVLPESFAFSFMLFCHRHELYAPFCLLEAVMGWIVELSQLVRLRNTWEELVLDPHAHSIIQWITKEPGLLDLAGTHKHVPCWKSQTQETPSPGHLQQLI